MSFKILELIKICEILRNSGKLDEMETKHKFCQFEFSAEFAFAFVFIETQV